MSESKMAMSAAMKSEYEMCIYSQIELHRLALSEGIAKARRIDEDIKAFLIWSAEHENIGYDEDLMNTALKIKSRAIEFESRDAFYGHRVCRKKELEIEACIPVWRDELRKKIEKSSAEDASFAQSQKTVFEAQLSECDVLEKLLARAKEIFEKNAMECPEIIEEKYSVRQEMLGKRKNP